MPELAFDRDGQSEMRPTAICLTAGQRTALDDLRHVIAAPRPLILLFGDMGSGKSSVIDACLAGIDPQQVVAANVSATCGDFSGPPTFETLLEAICKRLGVPVAPDQRPSSLAGLSTTVRAVADAGKTIVLCIDQADRLSNDVIVEVARLNEYLDVPPTTVVRIFVGSLDLASRIDTTLRRIGAVERLAEIRLSQPTADEVGTILAYEDSARLGGPMLTPGAIIRIGAYSKSNLHWAVPMADAARLLAEKEGAREVTPDLVREALLDIWSPDQPAATESSISFEPGVLDAGAVQAQDVTVLRGLADVIDRPMPIIEPAPFWNYFWLGSAPPHGSSRSRNVGRRRLALNPIIAVISIVAVLSAAAYLFGRGDSENGQPLGDSQSVSGQSGSIEPARPQSQLLPDAEDSSAGTALRPSDNPEDARKVLTDPRLDTDKAPGPARAASEPSAEGRPGGANTSKEGTPQDPAASTATSGSSATDTGSKDPQTNAVNKPKFPVAPPAKKPDERKTTPWVQVR